MKKIICFIAFSIIGHLTVNAQNLSLSQADKEEFKNRAIDLINYFKEGLEIIPTYEEEFVKDKAIRNTLGSFTSNAKVELAYANGHIKSQSISNYLYSLKSYSKKDQLVNIDILDFTIEDLKSHPTELGKYIIEFEFVQRFSKKKEISDFVPKTDKLEEIEWDYVDITTKRGYGILEKITTDDGTKWILLLHDIEVKSIEVLKN